MQGNLDAEECGGIEIDLTRRQLQGTPEKKFGSLLAPAATESQFRV